MGLDAQTPHEEEGGLHEEQTRRAAVSVVIEAAQKRKYCTPMEFQNTEGQNDSLKLELEKYMEKRGEETQEDKRPSPLASQQDACETDILEEKIEGFNLRGTAHQQTPNRSDWPA